MRVLLVEKNPLELEAMRLGLDAPDLDIEVSTDGDRALTRALKEPPRVVVTTSSLGQMGGFALSRELKTLHERGDLPEVAVIVLLERSVDSWLADWSRCDAHRTKPVDLVELESLVRQLGTQAQPTAV